jgi:hypothetical protein
VPGADGRTVLVDGPLFSISASQVRARVATGRSIRYLVPDAVIAYIGDHDLYAGLDPDAVIPTDQPAQMRTRPP